MATWSTRGLRGSTLEDMINRTNEKYREKGLALAYFDQKSTVDYIGAVQGVPVCFDAKECATDTFSLQNIHEHQVEFMLDFEKQRGVAFFLIYYTKRDMMYYLRIDDLKVFWDRAKEGGRKSFRLDELDPEYVIPKKRGVMVPYLEMIQKDLDLKDEED